MTDHEHAALAALVAWREAEIAVCAASRADWPRYDRAFLAAERKLREAADLLIAERAAAVGR